MESIKILVAIAKDKQEDIKIIKSAFAQLPQYPIIIVATSVKELIEKLQIAKQVPDLILMDIQMPSGDGLITSFFWCAFFVEKTLPIVWQKTGFRKK